MNTSNQLGWLPQHPHWNESFEAARSDLNERAVESLIELAGYQIDFIQTGRLDRALQKVAGIARSLFPQQRTVRLAILGSSTLGHLVPGIRVAGLRRKLWIDVYEAPYGMYRQELQSTDSGLRHFSPEVVLLSLDAKHALNSSGVPDALNNIQACWELAKTSFSCTVIQQTVLPVFQPLLGNNEHRYSQSQLAMTWDLNRELRRAADENNVYLLGVDMLSNADGIHEWHDEALWHRSKQEIHPRVSHIYGEHVARILAAQRGLSSKCLVLDLDNTLWGGVIGDDGMSGIALGQGNAVGEAHLAFQKYALELSRRGIILAVCSKNDEANALEVFEHHPDMLLRRKDIACFVANWQDKPSNLKTIASTLNIGLDSLVFADDNPFERNLVRRELPEVAVPELPEDPAFYANTIASAGYFEALALTAEDEQRAQQYQANAERDRSRSTATDMDSYLRDLKMELHWDQVDNLSLPRVVQLINKTNQFNLTTKRYSQSDVESFMQDGNCAILQFRLLDRFGDNGIIAVVVAKAATGRELYLDTWLMSCRVLGRQVEQATLNVIAGLARAMNADTLIGEYLPTAKNGMVRDHYQKLGFQERNASSGDASTWSLELANLPEFETQIRIVEGPNANSRNLQTTY